MRERITAVEIIAAAFYAIAFIIVITVVTR